MSQTDKLSNRSLDSKFDSYSKKKFILDRNFYLID